MIELFTATTPNGRKVSILLEELGAEYTVRALRLREQEQKAPDFLRINPNGRIPAILDDGFAVFESGAILLYLAEKYGCFLPTGVHERSRVVQWLMWQMGGLGPMQGQANVFTRYFPEKIPSVISRYQNEVRRLFAVLETHLTDGAYLAGDYSIADMACYPWIAQADWSGVSLEEYPHLAQWFARIGERPAVQRGMDVPAPAQSAQNIIQTAQDLLIR